MFSEVNVTALYISTYQFHAEFIAYVEALLTLGEQPFHMRVDDPYECSMLCHSSDDGREYFADAAAHSHGCDMLAHRALDFLCRIFLQCAVAGNGGKVVI